MWRYGMWRSISGVSLALVQDTHPLTHRSMRAPVLLTRVTEKPAIANVCDQVCSSSSFTPLCDMLFVWGGEGR
jgi:hypothetical protein